MQEKLTLWLTFNPGLALTGFRTTRPRKATNYTTVQLQIISKNLNG